LVLFDNYALQKAVLISPPASLICRRLVRRPAKARPYPDHFDVIERRPCTRNDFCHCIVEYVAHHGIGIFTHVPDSGGSGRGMAGAFGDFGTLTEAFMAAAVDPSRWDAAMDDAAKATGSFGAALQSWRGRLPQFPISERLLPVAETFVREGWVDRDIRYSGAACD
jgi:hypothetical protein